MWLEKAHCAGFTELVVVRREPMTAQRLMHYPVYQEGLLENLFGLVAPQQRDQLVESALICARAGGDPTGREQGESCALPPSSRSGEADVDEEYHEWTFFHRRTRDPITSSIVTSERH